MKQLFFFISVLISIILFFTSCNRNEKKTAEKPNIILIVADDLGWKDLHCYGNDLVETPHLDRLASEGIRFTNAYASCTVCSPTRAGLLTGKNPVAVNITDWIPGKQHNRGPKPSEKFIVPEFSNHLELEEITMAERLKEAGYKNISIGKWHLGGEGYLPTDQGFDINIAGNHKGMPPSYYYPYKAERFNFEITHLELGLDSLYLTDRLGNEAVQFIEKHADSLFFMYLPFYTVHTPWEGRPDLVNKYNALLEKNNDTLVRDPHFLAMIESLDQNVGKVMKTLDRFEITEKTLVIFVSDNGGLTRRSNNKIFGSWNYPLRGGKGTLYEGGLRVPTMVRWPARIKPGRVSNELVISTDVFPTVMEAVGLPVDNSIEGISLMKHLSKDEQINRETFYWHYPHYHHTNPGSVIRHGDYKLIYYYETEQAELYNLKTDPGEKNNVAEENPEKAAELKAKLEKWLKDNRASFPTPNPLYKPQLQ